MAHSNRSGSSTRIPVSVSGSTRIDNLLNINLASNSNNTPTGTGTDSTITSNNTSTQSTSATLTIHNSPTIVTTATTTTTNAAATTFAPRIVRASQVETNGQSPTTRPIVSTSPSRQRRTSGILALARTQQQQQQSIPSSTTMPLPNSPSRQVILPSPSTSFPLPQYLNHSSLRDLLCSESIPSLPPNRFRFDGFSAHSSSVPPFKRTESDDDNNSDTSVTDHSPRNTLKPLRSSPMTTQLLRLPTRWSENDRNSNLSVSQNGTDLIFTGPATNGEREAAAGRANFAVPPACGIYYYEVEVTNRGSKGYISIGFSAAEVRLNRLPGWEGQSWGYHGDDGQAFAVETQGKPYGPTYTSEDVIGCGIDFTIRRMFYTQNGRFLGLVFENVGINCDIFPTVGMRSPHESVHANFGQEPFKFDIDSYVRQEHTRVWRSIQATPVQLSKRSPDGSFGLVCKSNLRAPGLNASDEAPALSKDTTRLINHLVLSYLTHHGYSGSARAMRQQRDKESPGLWSNVDDDMDLDTDANEALAASAVLTSQQEEEEMDIRLKIVTAVQKGDINAALTGTKEHYPSVLDAEDGLMHFKLKCRMFVELMLKSAEILKADRSYTTSTVVDDSVANELDNDTLLIDYLADIKPTTATTDGTFDMETDQDSLTKVANGGNFPENTVPANGTRVNGHTMESNVKGKMRQVLMSAPLDGTFRQDADYEITARYQAMLSTAVEYGRALQRDYRNDHRSVIMHLFNRTFSLVAYVDPLSVGGEIAKFAGQHGRIDLAVEMNQRILAAQGHPIEPPLERLCRQTMTCVRQLGILGVGTAAFADVRREFLDN